MPPLDKAIHTRRGPLVLLFYDGYDLQAEPTVAGAMYARARCAARYAYRTLRQQQVWTGFYTAFRSLRESLRRAGCNVQVNNFALALRHPTYPIGIAGYPSALSKVALPNPAIFGPGDCGNPEQAPRLLARDRIRRLIQPCEWAAALYRKHVRRQHAGVAGRDRYGRLCRCFRASQGHRRARVRQDPLVSGEGGSAGPGAGDAASRPEGALVYEVLRYGQHRHDRFLHLVRRSRALLFLCEHETQGLACQEAMSCNVPVLAWDEGVLVDPQQQRFIPPGLTVSSVPYFDHRCGERFRIDDFEGTLPNFWDKLPHYAPRQYILDSLSMSRSASAYLEAYASLMR